MVNMSRTILVSACLLGLDTSYNGERREHPEVLRYLREHGLVPVPVCPEQLAGLPTPRASASFDSGDGEALLDGLGNLVTQEGTPMNEVFLHGARQTLAVARICHAAEALFKERSPSCGCTTVHRNGRLVAGQGVTTALLRRHGVDVFSEEDL